MSTWTWFKSLFTGKVSNNYTEVPPKTETKKNCGEVTQRNATEATFKAIGQTNKRKMYLEYQLYGNPKSNPRILSMERRIKNALSAKNRSLAKRLAIRKKKIETQLSRLEGQQDNIFKNKDLCDEMKMNKDIVVALKANNDAIHNEMDGIDIGDIDNIISETHLLQTDVSDISDALAFQGDITLDDMEGDEYLANLEKEMEEEAAVELLKNFDSVPEREDINNNNNNNNVHDKPLLHKDERRKDKNRIDH